MKATVLSHFLIHHPDSEKREWLGRIVLVENQLNVPSLALEEEEPADAMGVRAWGKLSDGALLQSDQTSLRHALLALLDLPRTLPAVLWQGGSETQTTTRLVLLPEHFLAYEYEGSNDSFGVASWHQKESPTVAVMVGLARLVLARQRRESL